MENSHIIKTPSLLEEIFLILYKNSSEKVRKELDRYDKLEFVDMNEEIKKKEIQNNDKKQC